METGNRSHGFSLLEMMITLVILGILVTIAAVNFGGLSREEELGRTALEIKKLAQRTLRTSLTRGQLTVIRITPSRMDAGPESLTLPGGVDLEIRRWGSTKWIHPDGYPWTFEPSGLCEPLGIRLTSAGGWQEINFHPLTAAAEEERSWFP